MDKPDNYYHFKLGPNKPELKEIGWKISVVKYEMRLDKKLKRRCRKQPRNGDYLYYADPFVRGAVCRCRVVEEGTGWCVSDSGELYTVVSHSPKQKCWVMDMQMTKGAVKTHAEVRHGKIKER
mgnify:CR=1 FL=1